MDILFAAALAQGRVAGLAGKARATAAVEHEKVSGQRGVPAAPLDPGCQHFVEQLGTPRGNQQPPQLAIHAPPAVCEAGGCCAKAGREKARKARMVLIAITYLDMLIDLSPFKV